MRDWDPVPSLRTRRRECGRLRKHPNIPVPGLPHIQAPGNIRTWKTSGVSANGCANIWLRACCSWPQSDTRSGWESLGKIKRSFCQERRKLRDTGLQGQPQQDCGVQLQREGWGHTAHQSLLTKPRHIRVSGNPRNPPVRGVQHRWNPRPQAVHSRPRYPASKTPVLEATGSLWSSACRNVSFL